MDVVFHILIVLVVFGIFMGYSFLVMFNIATSPSSYDKFCQENGFSNYRQPYCVGEKEVSNLQVLCSKDNTPFHVFLLNAYLLNYIEERDCFWLKEAQVNGNN